MIRHIVLTKFKADTDPAEIAAIYAGLAELVSRLPGASGFAGGRSHSPEGIERGYSHGFVIDFASWADLRIYADHPDHQALAARPAAHAIGGIDGILVMDLAIGE